MFLREQFWGRAARAPATRKGCGARYFCRIFANENIKGGADAHRLRAFLETLSSRGW
jgi:hypothetical protein